MKFTAKRGDLLYEVECAVSNFGAENISSSIALEEAGENLLLLKSTSADYQLFQEAELQVSSLDGRAPVAIRAKKLKEILKALDGEAVEISTRGLSASLRCGSFFASGLDCFSQADFPEPNLGEGFSTKIGRIDFRRACKKAVGACDQSSKLPIYQNPRIIVRNSTLTICGSHLDHRIVLASCDLDECPDFEVSLAPKALLLALDQPGGDTLAVDVGTSFVSFYAPGGGWRTLRLRRVEGAWPDYLTVVEGLISRSFISWQGVREQLLSMLWRIEATAGQEAAIDLSVDATTGTLGASWQGGNGAASDEMTGEGEAWRARANLTLLAASVKSCEGEQIRLDYYANEGKPFLRVFDDLNENDRDLIMCMEAR